MSNIIIPSEATPYIDALRALIRTGAAADPSLEASVLIDLPVVIQQSGNKASAEKRAHTFIKILQHVASSRLEGKDSETAVILFGFGPYAGVPVQERYRAVAKLYNPYWTWENYRKEPLTRHLLAVYLALKREKALTDNADTSSLQDSRSKTVLIVMNITREGPGLLRDLLDEVAVTYKLVDLMKNEHFPDPTQYAALVVLGGPDSANDMTPKVSMELEQIKKALDAKMPYLGICLGLQMATKLLGGEVVQSSVKEIGLRSPEGSPYSVSLTNIALTALGKKDPLFIGLRNDFRVFQLHGETVVLTERMQLMAVGRDCPNQIVKFYPKAYGIQSHFELTRPMLHEWLQADPELNLLKEEEVVSEFDLMEEAYAITGLSIFRNFLHMAGILT